MNEIAPRAKKSRTGQAKPYNDEQLVFLRSHLPEFERLGRAGNGTGARGDPKRFALARAEEFISLFGLPDDLVGTVEAHTRFREVRPFVVSLKPEKSDSL